MKTAPSKKYALKMRDIKDGGISLLEKNSIDQHDFHAGLSWHMLVSAGQHDKAGPPARSH